MRGPVIRGISLPGSKEGDEEIMESLAKTVTAPNPKGPMRKKSTGRLSERRPRKS